MIHPLTDAELHDKFNGYREEGWRNSIYCPDDMRAAYDLGRAEQLENVIDVWDDALQEEAECGVKFHSEKRSADMRHAYPVLTSFGAVLDAMRPTQEDNQ